MRFASPLDAWTSGRKNARLEETEGERLWRPSQVVLSRRVLLRIVVAGDLTSAKVDQWLRERRK